MKNLIICFFVCFIALFALQKQTFATVQTATASGVLTIVDIEAPAASTVEAIETPADAKPNFFITLFKNLGLDGWGVVNIVLGLIAFVFAGAWIFGKRKIKQAGELLIAVANAI